jgi:hypothetical protein
MLARGRVSLHCQKLHGRQELDKIEVNAEGGIHSDKHGVNGELDVKSGKPTAISEARDFIRAYVTERVNSRWHLLR